MVMLGECPACESGDHKGHVKHYRPAPEGMMGGSMCPCKGECTDRGPRLPGNLQQVVTMLRAVKEKC